MHITNWSVAPWVSKKLTCLSVRCILNSENSLKRKSLYNAINTNSICISVSLQQGESASECYCLEVKPDISKLKVVNIGSLSLQWRRLASTSV